jgi:hypothetical protein
MLDPFGDIGVVATDPPAKERTATEHGSDGKEEPGTQEPAKEQSMEFTANPLEGLAK